MGGWGPGTGGGGPGTGGWGPGMGGWGPGTGGAADSCGERPDPPGGVCDTSVCTGGCVDNTCIVDCTGYPSCWQETIDCPEGFACQVDCEAPPSPATGYGCRGATINCPDTYACDVNCSDSTICQNTNLNCTDGSCSMNCGFWSACSGAQIYCGEGECTATCSYTGYGEPPDMVVGDACDSSVFSSEECTP